MSKPNQHTGKSVICLSPCWPECPFSSAVSCCAWLAPSPNFSSEVSLALPSQWLDSTPRGGHAPARFGPRRVVW